MLPKRSPKLLVALLIAGNIGSLVHAQGGTEATADTGTEPVQTIESNTDPKEARDCFTTSPIFGDQDDNHVTFNDLDKLDTLKKDHVINAIRVCPDVGNRNVLGLQVSYTRFAEDGRIEDEL